MGLTQRKRESSESGFDPSDYADFDHGLAVAEETPPKTGDIKSSSLEPLKPT
jgi:hypothetical protein